AGLLAIFLISYLVSRLAAETRDQGRQKAEALAELETISERERSTSDFVSAVSFEMRTPLTSIQGFVEMLLELDYPEEKEREFAAIINDETQRMTSLVDELLDIARLESGKVKLQKKPVDPGRLVRENLAALHHPGDFHAISFQVPAELPELEGDPERLGKCFGNIFSFVAAKCDPGSGITVSAKSDGRELVFTISFRKATPRIPAPAELPHNTRENIRPEQGDLGLAMAQRILLAHRGSLNLVDIPGKWSNLVIRLLLPEAPELAGRIPGMDLDLPSIR
ncbi:MAG: sensor histidine kinase, partial [Candidatus Geothermincolia bacterium]